MDGMPTLNNRGVAGWHARFDERQDQVERVYVDRDGKRVNRQL
jgi:hypothetical protein